MRLKYTLVALSFFGVVFSVYTAISHSTGAPAGRYGSCGFDGCHLGVPGNGHLSIEITDRDNRPVSAYSPGVTYNVQVYLTDIEARRFGFELAAMAGGFSGGNAGRLLPGADTLVQYADGDSNYITHTLSGTQPRAKTGSYWNFKWSAPHADLGDITFYAAGNGANGDSTSMGDHVYSTNLVLPGPSTGISMDKAGAGALHLFPNPVRDVALLHFYSGGGMASISVYNGGGTLVKEVKNIQAMPGVNSCSLDLGNLAPGCYFVRVQTNTGISTLKALKM